MELFGNIKAFLYLIFAALAVFLAVRWGFKRKQAAISILFSRANYERLIPPALNLLRLRADILLYCGILFIFIALAAPQWGREKVMFTGSYSQAVIAMDISLSMKAQDLKPNRLEAAKTMADLLLSSVTNERLGLVVFTSQAYLQCPVTFDYSALRRLNRGINMNPALVQGTSLAAAVSLSANVLTPYSGRKAIVLISDGEDHSPNDLAAAVKIAKDNNISVITVGIGSQEGELIPQTPTAENGFSNFKKDKDGKTVLTKLDEKALIALARDSGGAYIKFNGASTSSGTFASAQAAADAVLKQLALLDKTLESAGHRAKYKNRYQIPLFVGILLIICSILIPLRKVK